MNINQCSIDDTASYSPDWDMLVPSQAAENIEDTFEPALLMLPHANAPASILVKTAGFASPLILDLGIGLGGYLAGMTGGSWVAGASCALTGALFPPILPACPWVIIGGASLGAGTGGVVSQIISQRLVHGEPETDWIVASMSGAVNMIPAGAVAMTASQAAGKVTFSSTVGMRMAKMAQYIAANNTLGWQPFLQRGIVSGGLGLATRSAVTAFDDKPGFDLSYVLNPIAIGIDLLGPEVIVRGLRYAAPHIRKLAPTPRASQAPAQKTSLLYSLISLLPSHLRVRAANHLGNRYYKNVQYKKAYRHYQLAGNRPGMIKVLLASNHPNDLKLAAQMMVEDGNLEAAAHAYKKTGDTRQANAIYNQLGDAHFSNKQYKKAYHYFKKTGKRSMMKRILRMDPSYGDANQLGDSYYTTGHYQSAYDCYQLAGNRSQMVASLRQMSTRANTERAIEILTEDGLFAEAAREAMRIKDHRKAALLFKRAGDLTLAAEAYRRAGNAQEAPTLYARLSDAYSAEARLGMPIDKERWDEVIERVIHLQDHGRAGDSSAMAGRWPEAAKHYQQANRPIDAAIMFEKAGIPVSSAEMQAFFGIYLDAAQAFKRRGLTDKADALNARVSKYLDDLLEFPNSISMADLNMVESIIGRSRIMGRSAPASTESKMLRKCHRLLDIASHHYNDSIKEAAMAFDAR